MGKTFYEAETPEEAMEIYRKGYDNVYSQLKVGNIRKILCSSIKSWEDLKVLEVGAGGGIYTDFLLKQGAEVTCVDICEPILKGNAKAHPEAKYILADATAVTLKEKFDLIFAIDIIEHIEDDSLFLENMNKHLRKDGLLIINTQNAFSLNYLIEGTFNFLKGNKNWCGWDPTHVRFYTLKSLKEKLGRTGFKINKWFGNYHLPYLPYLTRIFEKSWAGKIWHVIEIANLYDKLPFSITGWGIGVTATKVRDV